MDKKQNQQLQKVEDSLTKTYETLPAIYADDKKIKEQLLYIMDIRGVIDMRYPSLSPMVDSYGIVAISGVIVSYLHVLNRMAGVSHQLDKMQADDCAAAIISKYPHLSLADVLFVFQGIWRGEYGKLYERVNIDFILKAIDNYDWKRYCIIQERYITEANRYKRGIASARYERGIEYSSTVRAGTANGRDIASVGDVSERVFGKVGER